MEGTQTERVASVLHPDQDVDVCTFVTQLHDDGQRYYGDFYVAMMEEMEFGLSNRHYEDDSGNSRDKRVVQPHSLDLFHLLRHKWSQMSKSEIYIECKPVDNFLDAELADACKFALEHVLKDRRLRYAAARKRMIIGALSARAWGMKVEFDPSIRPFGELVFSSINPCDLMVAPGWVDMHDVTCPWVGEKSKMRINDVLRQAKYGWDTEGVKSDSTMSQGKSASTKGSFGRPVRLSRPGMPAPGSSEQETVTILKWWFREDPFDELETEVSPTIELDPENQYMECPNCGHTEMPGDYEGGALEQGEQPQDELGEQQGPPQGAPPGPPPGLMGAFGPPGPPQGQPSPQGPPPTPQQMLGMPMTQPQAPSDPRIGGPCPVCQQAPLIMTEFVEQEYQFLKYPEGRLIIVCPELNLVLYNDRWPVKLRSFPYQLLRAYAHPEDLYGQSDVSLLWSMVLIQDATLRSGWEQMIRNVDVIMTPRDGLIDSQGNPFLFTDEQGSIAYFKDPMAANLTKHFQGSGISQGWPIFLQSIQSAYRQNMGSTDIGMNPQELSQANVGTVQAAVQQGEIPLDSHIDDLNEEQSMFLGVVLDYIIGTWTVARWVRYSGMDGQSKAMQVLGTDLPYADVEVTVQPKMPMMDAQQVSAFQQWLALDPPSRQIMARLLNIPPSMVRDYERAQMQYQQALMESQSGSETPPNDPAAQQQDQQGKPGKNGNSPRPPGKPVPAGGQ